MGILIFGTEITFSMHPNIANHNNQQDMAHV
ncbi:hypothetical protein FNL37_1760 [Methylovorus glucosotrophus]|nr:hypothetical protein FNL37_1760 [Methylovorus glucosotrophus]